MSGPGPSGSVVQLRGATPADIPDIQRIAHATWPAAYANILSNDQLAYMLDRMYALPALEAQFTSGHRFILASQGQVPIGFASFSHQHAGTSHSRLHKLYVLPDHQGSGAGGRLLDQVEQEAREAGDRFLELNVNRFNPSLAWYQRKGFQVLRDEVLDIGQGFVMDDHVLIKSLA